MALQLDANKANRDWIDGLGDKDRTTGQRAAQGELVEKGRRAFTTRGAYFEFMDAPTSFGTLFSAVGFVRLMRNRGAGASV